MKKYLKINETALVVIVLLVLVVGFFAYPKNKIIVWAWERNENLTFLDSDTVVAYYAGSVIIKDGRMAVSKRVRTLKILEDTKVIPVVRIDNFDTAEEITPWRMKDIEDFIINSCDQKLVVGCQIDFDVKTSERTAYMSIISSVRDRLSKNIPLSITALVSWCDKSSWMNDAQIDFAVPMFYRLGADESTIRGGYTGKTFMGSPKCAGAIGISTDEPLPKEKYIGGRDIYIFNPNSWDEQEFRSIIKKM